MSCDDTIGGVWPGRLDLPLQQGDDFLLTLTLKQGGAALDLTGATFKAQARKRKEDVAVAFEYVCSVVVPATDGKVTLALAAAVTAAVTCGPSPQSTASQYHWDLEMVQGGAKRTLLEGVVRVNGEVTRG